jgi:hypothetical protein
MIPAIAPKSGANEAVGIRKNEIINVAEGWPWKTEFANRCESRIEKKATYESVADRYAKTAPTTMIHGESVSFRRQLRNIRTAKTTKNTNSSPKDHR